MDQSPMVCLSIFSSVHFRPLLNVRCRRFKLHLKPKTNNTIRVGDEVSLLPPNKSLVEIFADFLQYLFFCSKTFIQETVLPDGPSFWASVKNDIKFVLSHPNGWEGAQQSHMRRAAVLAGLVSNDRDDQDRIQFVTEGEASLHFCINSGLTIKVSFTDVPLKFTQTITNITGKRRSHHRGLRWRND